MVSFDMVPDVVRGVLQDWQTWMYIGLLIAGMITGKIIGKGSAAKADPTAVPGLPWLGNALALGRHGAAFVAACRHKYGDVFTLTLAGQKMQFWMEPKLINYFFSAPEEQITFRPAVEQFTQRVFGLPSKTFFPKHAKVLQDLRELLVPSSLAVHAAALASALERRMDQHLPVGQEVDLSVAMRRLVFGAGVETLFGREATQGESEEALEEEFHAFECGFELAASPVPHALQPRFCQARDALLAWLGRAAGRGALEGTTAGQLLTKADLPAELAANLLLAVLWASQANTVAASFWTVAFLLLPDHNAWNKEVLGALDQVGGSSGTNGKAVSDRVSLPARASVLALDRRSTACRCAAEAVRLRVQSIDVRMAASTFKINTSSGQEVTVPQGCIIAINPYLSHMDPQIYPDPLTFLPDRAVSNLDAASGPVVPSVAGLAFGAGMYRCPGRFFAEMEVALVAQMVLASRHLTLATVDTVSKPTALQAAGGDAGRGVHGVGSTAGAAAAAAGVAGDSWWQPLLDQLLVRFLGPSLATWGFGVGLPLPQRPADAANTPLATAGTSGPAAAGQQQPATGIVTRSRAAKQPASSSAAVDTTTTGFPTAKETAAAAGSDTQGFGTGPEWWLHHSGDPQALLPRPDLLRLVGVKAPAEPCWVTVAKAHT